MNKNRLKLAFLVIFIIILAIVLNYNNKIVPQGIKNVAAAISQSVEKRDGQAFMNCIDIKNKEFYAEERHLFQDIAQSGIKDFQMKAGSVKSLDTSSVLVGIIQTYLQDNRKKTIRYDAVFTRDGGTYKFHDLYFKEIDTRYFTVRYRPKLERAAHSLAGFIDQVYENVKLLYGRAPEDKTIVKLYDDNEVFNAFIKPSIGFSMAGWYEYPESIKLNLSSITVRLLPASMLKDTYFPILSHELTHRISSMETKNNIPYWLAEGIATYVENDGKLNTGEPKKSLAELEKISLEAMTDNNEIADYYRDSYIYTSLLVKRLGLDGLHRLLAELGKYPLEEKTQGVIYMESNSRFHEVIKKLYDTTIEQFDGMLRG